jgi:hypothetical protein
MNDNLYDCRETIGAEIVLFSFRHHRLARTPTGFKNTCIKPFKKPHHG